MLKLILAHMPHQPILCHRCGLRIPNEGECEEAHEVYGDVLEYAEELPEDERAEILRVHQRQTQRHKALLCHCLDRPFSLFTSRSQPGNLNWRDKHDR